MCMDIRSNTLKPLKDFDPRPEEYHGTALQQLEKFLKNVYCKGLGISMLLDKDVQVWKHTSDVSGVCADPDAAAVMPSRTELHKQVVSFQKSLQLTAQQVRELEMNTRDQSLSYDTLLGVIN